MNDKTSLKLDKKDKKILCLLDLNAKMNYSELAKKVKTTKQVIRYRINRLEQAKIIKGYYAVIDHSKLGLTNYRLNFKLRNTTPKINKEILDYLAKKFTSIALFSGKWDLAVGINVKTISEFYTFWDDLLKKYSPYIRDYSSCVYSPIHLYSRTYLLDQKESSQMITIGNSNKENVDEKDLQILQILSKNARIPLIELSKKAHLSSQLARYRIKQLEKKKIIAGYRTNINVNKLGYQTYKVYLRLSNYNNLNSFREYCKLHKNITLFNRTIGSETTEIEIHAKSLQEMLNIISNLEENFPIESFDYNNILSVERTSNLSSKKPL